MAENSEDEKALTAPSGRWPLAISRAAARRAGSTSVLPTTDTRWETMAKYLSVGRGSDIFGMLSANLGSRCGWHFNIARIKSRCLRSAWPCSEVTRHDTTAAVTLLYVIPVQNPSMNLCAQSLILCSSLSYRFKVLFRKLESITAYLNFPDDPAMSLSVAVTPPIMSSTVAKLSRNIL